MRNNDHALKKSTFLLLHISLLFSSLSGVCSKKASGYTDHIFSLPFIFWFGLVFVIMFGYAIIWQQILKRMPLTVAYANPSRNSDLGNRLGSSDLWRKDHLEYDRRSSCDFCRNLSCDK